MNMHKYGYIVGDEFMHYELVLFIQFHNYIYTILIIRTVLVIPYTVYCTIHIVSHSMFLYNYILYCLTVPHFLASKPPSTPGK